eukprot:1617452-Pyramimonas_sp.AAC.1
MDLEAFDVEVFSGAARWARRRLLARERARHPDWVYATVDIDKAFFNGLTYRELAEATGAGTQCLLRLAARLCSCTPNQTWIREVR